MRLRCTQPLTDAEIDGIVSAWEASAAAAGMTIEEWIEREYRRYRPKWLQVADRIRTRWHR